MTGVQKAYLQHRYNELMALIFTNKRMANEHRSLEIERGGYATSIEYWRGREDAWQDAADLIRHYLGGDEDESEIQP